MYTDEDVATLYDLLYPWETPDDLESYLGPVTGAGSVVDIGCGSGMLAHRARQAGHTGRLCGIDPYRAALDRARVRADVEWIEGTAADLTETTGARDGTPLGVDRASLRFLDAGALAEFLGAAGFAVEDGYASWDLRPVAPDSRLIVTVARATDG